MEYQEFIKQKRRMCEYFESKEKRCINCPLSNSNNRKNVLCYILIELYPVEAEKIVQDWAKGHPEKTILQDFLEKYPNARFKDKGIPFTCAMYLGYLDECKGGCIKCWNRPLNEFGKERE